MKKVIEKAHAADVWRGKPTIVIVAPAPIEKDYNEKICKESMGLGCSEKSHELGNLFKELAALLGCQFIDATPIVPIHHRDGIHITVEGHRNLALALYKEINQT